MKYPTQAGAFFQWGLPKDADQDYFRLAYHPTAYTVNHWIKDIQFFNSTSELFLPVWGTAPIPAEDIYDYGYKNNLKLVLTDTIVLLTDILTE